MTTTTPRTHSRRRADDLLAAIDHATRAELLAAALSLSSARVANILKSLERKGQVERIQEGRLA